MIATQALAAPDPEAAALSDGLQLADKRDWDRAEVAAEESGPVGRDIIEWRILRAGQGTAPEYPAFLKRRPDWPGLPYLRRAGEKVIGETGNPVVVRDYFAHHAPMTAAGSLALQQALLSAHEATRARDEARRAWKSLSYSKDEQAQQLALFGHSLLAHHVGRLYHLLWEGRLDEARRMLPLVAAGPRALAEARIRLQADEKGVDDAIARVPGRLKHDAGLAFDRFRWRFDKGYYDSAADLILARSTSARSLGEPEAWARMRASLARREMREGDPHRAYRIAEHHFLKGGAAYADLEFVAGYIALRKLHAPKTALRHFDNLRRAVSTPISLGRAAYWEGRAYDAMGDRASARKAYEYGSKFQTAFYGLLSAEKLGRHLDPALLGNARYADWRRQGFLASSALRAGLLLVKADDKPLATRFFLQVAEGLPTKQLGPLSDLALAIREPHIAVRIAKLAAERGTILPRAYFPITPLAHANLPVPPALALAIARRESEFAVGIVSPAGARGLMQVMPSTARRMSGAAGLPYDKARLTTDGIYNARLGSIYLAKLIDEFGPAITLVAAGYNAGPNRPRAWIQQFGDPRAPDVDPVDWIEQIPYSETRNYVMRVAESLIIYRAKLAGRSGPIRLYEALKGH